MKVILLLVFCVGRAAANPRQDIASQAITTGLTLSFGAEEHQEAIGPIEENNTRDSNKRINRLVQRRGVGLRPNEPDVTNENNFDRVCCTDDLECIRNFFYDNSKCKRQYGPVPDPLELNQNTEVFAAASITVTFGNFTLTGLSSAKIFEFFFNKVTRNLVLGFQITNMNVTSNNTYFSYHMNGREPITTRGQSSVFFNAVNVTVIIPRVKTPGDNDARLRFDSAQAYALVDGSNDLTVITTSASLNSCTNSIVQQRFTSLQTQTAVIGREILVLMTQLIAAVFVQYNICDFDVDMYSI